MSGAVGALPTEEVVPTMSAGSHRTRLTPSTVLQLVALVLALLGLSTAVAFALLRWLAAGA